MMILQKVSKIARLSTVPAVVGMVLLCDANIAQAQTPNFGIAVLLTVQNLSGGALSTCTGSGQFAGHVVGFVDDSLDTRGSTNVYSEAATNLAATSVSIAAAGGLQRFHRVQANIVGGCTAAAVASGSSSCASNIVVSGQTCKLTVTAWMFGGPV